MNKTSSHHPVFSGEETVCNSIFTSSPCSTNSVNIIFNGHGEGVIDDIFNIWNVKTSGSDICGNKNIDSSSFEFSQCLLSLPLCLVTMNTTNFISSVPKIVFQVVCFKFFKHENYNSIFGFLI